MPIIHDSIRTNSTLDVYPTHEASLGKGGYRTVADIAERDNIPFERCEVGMLVTVLSDNTNNNKRTTYILKQSTRERRVWEPYNDKVYDKFIVIAVAGGGSAVGYDESPIKDIYSTSKDEARIRQLGFYGDDNLKVIPLGWCAQNLQDMRPNNRRGTPTAGTKGIHLPLANELLPHIPKDYGILILPLAFGGTSFTSGDVGTYNSTLMKPSNTGGGQGVASLKWGVGTAYYQTLRDRIKHALSLNSNNRFAGIIWCQGEFEADNRAAHKTQFERMTNQLFTDLNNAGYGPRTPKGTFDKDIWYNYETAGYWYMDNNVRFLWENYRKWNPRTYIEIHGAESNIINGTGSTSSNKTAHFGNDSFSKVIAPRVAQFLIRDNEFSNIRTEKEVTKDEIGPIRSETKPYGANLEAERVAVRSDFSVNHSSVTFSVDSEGNVTSSQNLSGKFAFHTGQPFLDFGDIYKLEFEVSRNMYFLVYEADLARKNFSYVALGGHGRNFEITQVLNGTATRMKYANDADGINYVFVRGDKLRIIRNRDQSITIYRTHQNNGRYQHWLNFPKINLTDAKGAFGFFFGISGDERTGVGEGDRTLFKKLIIQKEEALISEKYLKNEFDNFYLRIRPLERTVREQAQTIQTLQQTIATQAQTITNLTNRITALETPLS